MVDLAELAAIAEREYRLRLAAAHAKVRSGALTQAQADRLMLPWEAIAVLCRADLAACSAALAAKMLDAREAMVWWPGPGQPVQHHVRVPEDHVRALFARDLCPPLVWGPALSAARDAALAKAAAPAAGAGVIERARDLNILARALDVPLTPASCARPNDRKAA